MKIWLQRTRWTLLFLCVSVMFTSTSAERTVVNSVVGTSLTFPTWVPLSGSIQYEGRTIGQVLNKVIDTDTVERFKNRLHWDIQTGLFTLTDLNTGDSGAYTVESLKDPYVKVEYQLEVYETVSVPNVTATHSSPDKNLCSLLCSVRNVRGLSLFWYKGNVKINHTGNSSLNAIVYLPLEIENSDNDSFTCVASNPISNKTTTVNITTHCLHSPAGEDRTHYIVGAVLSTVFVVAAVVVAVFLRRRRWIKESSHYTEDPSATEGPQGEVQYSVITHRTDSQAHIHESFPEESHRLTTIYDQIQPCN
ncbi:SLAM family member 5-like isoform X2 [Brachyhypopomus gauderio]|uniref:SLAM family member 5-like isoform X2 n=1 Tax=Brachyhypopomus gauderio TaxID=698409 RepID=UPI0040422BCB